jgi:hypothetical protein
VLGGDGKPVVHGGGGGKGDGVDPAGDHALGQAQGRPLVVGQLPPVDGHDDDRGSGLADPLDLGGGTAAVELQHHARSGDEMFEGHVHRLAQPLGVGPAGHLQARRVYCA